MIALPLDVNALEAPAALTASDDWFFEPQFDEGVVGSNPENADVDNPRGLCYGLVGRILATNSFGDRRISEPIGEPFAGCNRELEQEIAVMAAALNTRLKNLQRLPVGWGQWQSTRPAYGSKAYQAYGQFDDWEEEALRRFEETGCVF